MKSKNIYIYILVSIAIVAGAYISYTYSRDSRPENLVSTDTSQSLSLDSFAQCLAEKKVTMYGAEWCSHCKKQKALFGSSFSYVPYVECPDNIQMCLTKGIQGYPTWIGPDGVLYVGEQKLSFLAEISGCSI